MAQNGSTGHDRDDEFATVEDEPTEQLEPVTEFDVENRWDEAFEDLDVAPGDMWP